MFVFRQAAENAPTAAKFIISSPLLLLHSVFRFGGSIFDIPGSIFAFRTLIQRYKTVNTQDGSQIGAEEPNVRATYRNGSIPALQGDGISARCRS